MRFAMKKETLPVENFPTLDQRCSEVTLIRRRPAGKPIIQPSFLFLVLFVFFTLAALQHFSQLYQWSKQLMIDTPHPTLPIVLNQENQRGTAMPKTDKKGPVIVDPTNPFRLQDGDCKIPKVALYSRNFNRTRPKLLANLEDCSKAQEFTALKDNVLHLTSSKLTDCCVREIYRKHFDVQDSYNRRSVCLNFTNGEINVKDLEFMEARCIENETGRKLYNYHANVPITKALLKKVKYWEDTARSGNDIPPSILLLVIDSTSRPDVQRDLPQTLKFMTEEMGFVDFKGHHPMGEATVRNAISLLTGLHLEAFVQEHHKRWKDYWDATPLLWTKFHNLSYVTGYLEDMPRVGTFNHGGQRGFNEKPADLYLRPLHRAHESKFPHFKKICFGKRTFLQFMLDYKILALNKLKNVPSLLISWPCWPNHDIERSLSLQDSTYLNFFKTISKQSEILQNLWIILTADHGFYRGRYAQTHEGLLDRRSIPLFIRPSEKSLTKRPELREILEWNSERVTGHFDLYQTLLDLALISNNASAPNGQSLLSSLKWNRTCKDAGIVKQMCACNLPPPGSGSTEARKLKIVFTDLKRVQSVLSLPNSPNAAV